MGTWDEVISHAAMYSPENLPHSTVPFCMKTVARHLLWAYPNTHWCVPRLGLLSFSCLEIGSETNESEIGSCIYIYL